MQKVVVVKTRTYQAKTRSSEEGYSLLELLVVLALIGLVLSVTSGIYAKIIPGYEARQLAYDFANYCRALRSDAVIQQTTKEISFGAAGNSAALSGAGLNVPTGVAITYEPESQWAMAGEYYLKFYPSGGSNGGVIKMNWSNSEIRLEVDWVSGSVMVMQ